MTFRTWLNKQRERDDPVGDLARDMRGDKSMLPTAQSYRRIHAHLTLKGACSEAFDALDGAWEEFLKSQDVDGGGRSISLKLRWAILERDEFSCVVCGRDRSDGVKLEVDHIIPVASGGQTAPQNLQTLCYDCNRGKGNQ